MSAPPVAPQRAGRLRRLGSWLFVGTLLGNLLAYVFFLVLARTLSPGELGAVGSLVNVFAISLVPGLGLQLVAARRVSPRATDEAARQAIEYDVIRASALIGLGLTLVLGLLSFPLTDLLHLRTPVSILFVGLAALPTTMTYAMIGLLQGEERFARVSAAYLLIGLARAGSAVVASLLDLGPTGVMGLFALGWVVTVAGVWWLLRSARRSLPDATTPPAARGVREMAASGLNAAVPMSGLLVLTSVDVLLARHYLSRADSGAYTVGALFEKVAFWGPGFLATLYFPRMARPQERADALRKALLFTVLVGAAGVAVTLALGGPLVQLVGGDGFPNLSPTAWLFALLGVCQAGVQVLIYADLAIRGRLVGYAVWVAAIAAMLIVRAFDRSIDGVVTTMLITTGTLVVVALALVLVRWHRAGHLRRPGPDDIVA